MIWTRPRDPGLPTLHSARKWISQGGRRSSCWRTRRSCSWTSSPATRCASMRRPRSARRRAESSWKEFQVVLRIHRRNGQRACTSVKVRSTPPTKWSRGQLPRSVGVSHVKLSGVVERQSALYGYTFCEQFPSSTISSRLRFAMSHVLKQKHHTLNKAAAPK